MTPGASARSGLLCPATTVRGFSDSIVSSAEIHSVLVSGFDSAQVTGHDWDLIADKHVPMQWIAHKDLT
jgi:hypothetical protein